MYYLKSILLKFYWKITKFYLSLKGVNFGSGIRCNGFPIIKIRKNARIIFGENCQINASPRFNTMVISGATSLRAMEGAIIEFKDNAGISGSRIVATKSIMIGKGTQIGANCLIMDSNRHSLPIGSGNPVMTKPIHIGDRVFVGANSIILKGVKLGDSCVVAAGSVVTKSFPPNCLIGGNPAKIIKFFTP